MKNQNTKKYHYKLYIYSDRWKFIRTAKVVSDVNLAGILREGLFIQKGWWYDEVVWGVVDVKKAFLPTQ
mgnify:CR=1 FL=1